MPRSSFREQASTTESRLVCQILAPVARSPNLNAYAERFVRTIKESCLDRMIFFGERTLWNAINEFVEFYHHERTHQGLGNRLIDPPERIGVTRSVVACRERLGGVLRYYYRKAA